MAYTSSLGMCSTHRGYISRGIVSFSRIFYPTPTFRITISTVSKVVDEYLPTIKGISDGVKVNRLVCGSCLDFKLMITVPLDDFGPWEESGHAPEAEFLEKLKAIDGVSQVETQTITNVEI